MVQRGSGARGVVRVATFHLEILGGAGGIVKVGAVFFLLDGQHGHGFLELDGDVGSQQGSVWRCLAVDPLLDGVSQSHARCLVPHVLLGHHHHGGVCVAVYLSASVPIHDHVSHGVDQLSSFGGDGLGCVGMEEQAVGKPHGPVQRIGRELESQLLAVEDPASVRFVLGQIFHSRLTCFLSSVRVLHREGIIPSGLLRNFTTFAFSPTWPSPSSSSSSSSLVLLLFLVLLSRLPL